MKPLSMLAFLIASVPALAQALPPVASDLRPPSLKKGRTPLSFWQERALEEKLAPKPHEPDLRDYVHPDFRFLGKDVLSLAATGANWKPYDGETFTIRHGLEVKYEPKHIPPNLIFGEPSAFGDIVIRPLGKLLER